MSEDKKMLIIIDGNAVVHRAFHALPPLTSKTGEVVNAVYGFLLVFFRAIKDFSPDFVAVAFDHPSKTFRHKEYDLYKANRPKTADGIVSQLPMVKDIVKEFGVQIFEKQGYEADDIMATISKIAVTVRTVILSGDQDVLQLVDEGTKVYLLKKGVKDIVLFDEEKVMEKFGGLKPKQLLDYKALRGDSADNIPGVFGIGEKTAISLIKDYSSLENIYDNIDKINGLVKEKLLKNKDKAFLSKRLAEIKTDIDVDFDLNKCKWSNYDRDRALKALSKYGFKTLISRLPELKEKKSNLSLW